MSKQNNCEVGNCQLLSDYTIYPDDKKRNDWLAVFLCFKHYEDVLEIKGQRESLYRVASKFVTKSLG